MSFGRLHVFLVATKAGDVIYERFYDRLNETEKAEVRAAFQQASSSVRLTVDEQDHCGCYRSARFTFILYTDVVFFLMGSGEYDELANAEILRAMFAALSDVLGKPPSAQVLLSQYSKMVLVVDEMINEGLLETLDRDAIRKATKGKATWE